MRKLFATDLDGTLFDQHMNISDYNCRYIKKLNALKHCFVIDTGRPYQDIDFLRSRFGIGIDYFITLNGALILDGQGNIMKHETMKQEALEAVYAEIKNEDFDIYFSTGFQNFKLAREDKSIDGSIQFIEDTKELKDIRISKIALICKTDDVKYTQEACRRINSLFGSSVNAYRNVKVIDIAPAGCSKGSGIEYIREFEKIEKKETYAIGDSWNDEPMFESVENSFTFGRAEKALQRKAKHIVGSVGECIEKYILV